MPAKVAVLMLLQNCNMFCDYCVIENKYEVFPESEFKNFIQKLKAENYTHIILGGGEPTIWPGNLLNAVTQAKQLGFFVQIGTNGIHANQDLINTESIDRWIVPLDSSLELVHNSVRHYKTSHYQCIINLLNELKKRKKPLYISTVLTSKNIDSLDTMVDFLNEYNNNSNHLIAWNLYKLLPFGRGPQLHYKELQISDLQFSETIAKLKNRKRNFKILIRRNMYASNNVDFYVFLNQKIQSLKKMSF